MTTDGQVDYINRWILLIKNKIKKRFIDGNFPLWQHRISRTVFMGNYF